MKFYVNELSLHKQFPTATAFKIALKQLFACKSELERHGHRLRVRRTIAQAEPIPDITLRKVLYLAMTREERLRIERWFDQEGPFWDEDRESDPEGYFQWTNVDFPGNPLIDCGLNEATVRCSRQQGGAVTSFHPSNFAVDPISMIWHAPDGSGTPVDVRNFWETPPLSKYLLSIRSPMRTWHDLITYARADFEHLTILDSAATPLEGRPFVDTIAERIYKLLGMLNHLKTCFRSDGEMTVEGHDLIRSHFSGSQEAPFSNESASNQTRFRKELTFAGPDGSELFCPWHGKINYRNDYHRFHFTWPVVYNKPLYIVYIGQKITKN